MRDPSLVQQAALFTVDSNAVNEYITIILILFYKMKCPCYNVEQAIKEKCQRFIKSNRAGNDPVIKRKALSVY